MADPDETSADLVLVSPKLKRRALFGMGRPGSASIFTISRLKACAGPPMLMDRPWTSGASLLARGFNAPSYNR